MSAGFIVDAPGRPRVRVTRIVRQAKAVLGMELPLLSRVGLAEAERYSEPAGSR